MVVVQFVHFAMIEILVARLAAKMVVMVETIEQVPVECTIHSTMMEDAEIYFPRREVVVAAVMAIEMSEQVECTQHSTPNEIVLQAFPSVNHNTASSLEI